MNCPAIRFYFGKLGNPVQPLILKKSVKLNSAKNISMNCLFDLSICRADILNKESNLVVLRELLASIFS
jgi:hypothetical protein